MSSRRTLSSVRNAARLLKAFSSRQPEFGVTELAERLDIGKSTVHRLLATLLDEDLVEQDPETGRYRLGLAVHDLGGASASSDLHAAVLLPMSVLRNRTGETVHVGVLDGREVVYVERLDSPHTLRLFVDVGRRNDAHATGTGKCLLAHISTERLDALLSGWQLPAKTPYTITDSQQLRRDLLDVRRRGYAGNRQESEVGVLSIAAPIRDASGQVVAAMSVAGPLQRMEPSQPAIVAAVREAAAVASQRLGWRARRAPGGDAPALLGGPLADRPPPPGSLGGSPADRPPPPGSLGGSPADQPPPPGSLGGSPADRPPPPGSEAAAVLGRRHADAAPERPPEGGRVRKADV